MKKKRMHIVLLVLVCTVIICGVSFGLYVGGYYRAGENAKAALVSDELVTVSQLEDGSYVFAPEDTEHGLIFYPGGKVEYTAYAPLMREYAEQGILCVLVEMPFHLAVLDMNAADDVLDEIEGIENWVIGGHSLGGSMAASYVAKNPDVFEGILLLASYSTADLRKDDLEVVSLYGSEDGVLNLEKYAGYRENLPEDTYEVVLEGGCHAYFGDYGAQDGDGTPAVTCEEQIAWAVETSISVLWNDEN